jgi:hypothetical protein
MLLYETTIVYFDVHSETNCNFDDPRPLCCYASLPPLIRILGCHWFSVHMYGHLSVAKIGGPPFTFSWIRPSTPE